MIKVGVVDVVNCVFTAAAETMVLLQIAVSGTELESKQVVQFVVVPCGNVEEETELLLRSQVQVRLKPEDLRNVILIACVVVATIVDATPEIRVSHKKKHK